MQKNLLKISFIFPFFCLSFFLFSSQAKANSDYVCYTSQSECSSTCTWTAWDTSTHTRSCLGTYTISTHWGNTRSACNNQNASFGHEDGLRYGQEKQVFSCTVKVQTDTSKPTVTWSPNPASWINHAQTFTATCSDTISGCVQATKTCSVSSNGGTCSMTVADQAGNTATYSSPAAKIDTTLPIVTWSPSPAPWTNTNQTFTATCSDSQSGCSKAKYTCNVLDHNSNCEITAQDKAGNQKKYTSPFSQIDRLSPVCKITGNSSGEAGWFLATDQVQATCEDLVAALDTTNHLSGQSGCQPSPAPVAMQLPPSNLLLAVKDKANNQLTCNTTDLKVHYVEIRGQQNLQQKDGIKTELTNLIKQNIANLTRNQSPNSDNNNLSFNLQNGNIAYYEGNVILGAFQVDGKKTIIVQNGNLTLNGNITYKNSTSVLGIIVLGDVTIGQNVDTVYGVLFSEGTVFSENQAGNNQLYWKGSLISDNTIGGFTHSPLQCPAKDLTCTQEIAKKGDLNFFRSYFQGSGGTHSDPLDKHAPMVIEYDSSIMQNTPYGFEVPQELFFNGN